MYNLYNIVKWRLRSRCRFCWVGPCVNVRDRTASIGKAGHDDGRSNERPLKHRTLSAAIVDQLRQAILDGTYPAGSQLRQDALGDAYGVSRIPVREALFQLEAEGLVRISRKRARSSRSCRWTKSTTCSICAGSWSRGSWRSRRRILRNKTLPGWTTSRSASRTQSRRATSASGGSSMPTSIWRCTFTRGGRGPRRSSSHSCRPATATRACNFPTPRRSGRRREHARLVSALPGAADRRGLPVSGAAYRGGADGLVARRRWRLDRAPCQKRERMNL